MDISRLQLGLMIGLQVLSGGDSTVLWSTQNDTVVAAVLLGRADKEAFLREAKKLLGNQGTKVGRIVSYDDMEGMHRAEGAGGGHSSYENARHHLLQRGLLSVAPVCPKMLEALKLGASLTVRAVEADCSSKLLASEGAKLNRLWIHGRLLEVVGLVVQRPGKDRHKNFTPVTIFVKTSSRLNKRVGRAVLDHFLVETRASDLILLLRNDSWFVQHPSFPLIYLAERTGVRLLEREEFYRSQEIYCAQLGGEIGCH